MKSSARFALVLGLCLASCVPPAARGGGGGGGGGGLSAVAIEMPDDGAEVSAPFTMSATGKGVVGVFFHVSGSINYVTTPPYEFTVDPLTLPKGLHNLRVEVQGMVQTVNEYATVRVVRVRPSPAEITAAIAALQPGEWYEIAETQMRDVDLPFGHAYGDQAAIIGAVSGGAYDTKRERYIVWGGGSTNIWRNEVTVFDMNTYQWIRLNDPSDFPPGGEGNALDLAMHPDGAPVSRHSFCTVHYIPEPVDRLYVGGGDVAGAGSALFRDNHTYLFDFDTLTWTQGVETVSAGHGSQAAVAPDLRVWQHGGGGAPQNRLSVIDVAAQTATEHVPYGVYISLDLSTDIHALRNEFVTVGEGMTRVWDLDSPDSPAVTLATTGDREIEDVGAVGFAYHPPSGLMVAWAGGRDVYALDLATATWTKRPGVGIDPGPPADRGSFNRWRYVPSRNVFIICNDVDRNVVVHRFE